jgi:transposase InsO family protein
VELWHRRLAHLHYRALPSLRKIVTSLPEFEVQHNGVCQGSALGKNVKKPFPNSDSRANGILNLIHSDLCGPMSVTTQSGHLYFMIFIDDYSWKTWIYFLKSKESDEVLDRFQELRALVENQSGKRIKVLWSNNGGEYTSGGFVDFCSEAVIKREFTGPYNPQQNGVAERKNRTIISAVKAIINDQGFLMFLWAETCSTTVYVQNRCPHQTLRDMTPEEAFTGEKPEIGHLRIFGYSMYVHVPWERRTKLDPSGRKGVFVDYNKSAKAYRIYIPGQRKIELSRDVTFEEDIAYQRSKYAKSDSDEQEAPQEVLASSSTVVERESMEEDDSVPPTDPVNSFVPDLDLVDPTVYR